jgi:excisionase family DNA binding protein
MTATVNDPSSQPAAQPAEWFLYEVREVAEALRISRSKVYLLMNDGDLPSVRIGSRRLVRRSDLEAFVNALAAA